MNPKKLMTRYWMDFIIKFIKKKFLNHILLLYLSYINIIDIRLDLIHFEKINIIFAFSIQVYAKFSPTLTCVPHNSFKTSELIYLIHLLINN